MGAVVRRGIMIYSSDWNYRFPEFYTSMKSVFNNHRKCIYWNSFGVYAIINPNKICIRYNMKVLSFHIITNTNLIWVDNGVDAETVPVNTSFLIIKVAFLFRCKLGKTIISIRTDIIIDKTYYKISCYCSQFVIYLFLILILCISRINNSQHLRVRALVIQICAV